MAACSATDLLADACDNGFSCLDPRSAKAVELALMASAFESTETLQELLVSACENGFSCLNPETADAIETQMWCNAVNL